MKLISLFIAILSSAGGILIGLWVIRRFKSFTRFEFTFIDLLINSSLAGLSGFLLFFSLIGITGYFDENYVWNVEKFFGSIFISMFPGLVIFIGTIIRGIFISQYKKQLLNIFRNRLKK